jgi:hypothetical protein
MAHNTNNTKTLFPILSQRTGLHNPDEHPGFGFASAFRLGAAKPVKNSTAAKNTMVFFTVRYPFNVELHRDNVLVMLGLPDNRRNVELPGTVTKH